MADGGNPKLAIAGTAAATLLLGLGSGALLAGQLTPTPGAVHLQVSGAMALTVFCGDTTVNREGNEIRFLARDQECKIEAALSPVMPIRGELFVTTPGRYRCSRDGTELLCAGPE
ncbi:MAG: hypothetical protein ACI8PZ_007137 [Myxococcota bacterium]